MLQANLLGKALFGPLGGRQDFLERNFSYLARPLHETSLLRGLIRPSFNLGETATEEIAERLHTPVRGFDRNVIRFVPPDPVSGALGGASP